MKSASPNQPQGLVPSRDASRELDALVAEKVMGWTADAFRYRAVEREWGSDSPFYAAFGVGDATLAEITASIAKYPNRQYRPEAANVPHYSTDIAAAWLVVAALRARRWDVRVETDGDGWECSAWDDPEDSYIAHASETTAPLAICRAALLAVETPHV